MIATLLVGHALDGSVGPAMLYQVWIDTNMGIIAPADWCENSDPQPLASALDEAAECRRLLYPVRILPVACGGAGP